MLTQRLGSRTKPLAPLGRETTLTVMPRVSGAQVAKFAVTIRDAGSRQDRRRGTPPTQLRTALALRAAASEVGPLCCPGPVVGPPI